MATTDFSKERKQKWILSVPYWYLLLLLQKVERNKDENCKKEYSYLH